jgi:hypothetical protein
MLPLHGRVLLLGSFARLPFEAFPLAVVVAVASERRDPTDAAVVLAAATLPQIVTGPLLGAALDRSARPDRHVSAALVATSAAMLVVGVSGVAPLPSVAAAFALAATSPVLTGGISGLIGRWGGDTRQLSAWDGVAYNAAGLAAPVLVTALAALSTVTCFAVLAALAVGGLAVRVPTPDPLERHGPRAGDVDATARIGPALRAIWRTPSLRAVTVATTLFAAGWGGIELALATTFAARGDAAAGAGVVLSVVAVAALAGSLVLTRPHRDVDPARLTIVALLVTSVAVAALGAPSWPVLVVAGLVVGVLDAVILVGTYRTRHRDTPPHVRASVFTIAASMKLGASALGALLAGFAAAQRPGSLALAGVAAVTAGSGLLGLALLRARGA